MNKRIGLLLLLLMFGSTVSAQRQRQSPSQPPPNPASAPSQPNAPAPPTAAQLGQAVHDQPPPVPEPAQRPQGRPAQPATPAKPAEPNVPAVPSIPGVPPIDPLSDVMFPPDLILGHSRELLLTPEQKSYMRGEVQRATIRFNELQWELHDAMDDLHQTLEASSVNDQEALIRLDKVLRIEREIKRLHFSMGIRLKNKLTPEQQAKLQKIRMGRPWAVGQNPFDNP